MKIKAKNDAMLYEKLKEHLSHDVVIAAYGEDCVCLECMDCNEVILDGEYYTLVPRTLD